MADEADVGKLFVGGISRDTSDVILKEHFFKYGDVLRSVIAKDRVTGLPRGFGFITFSNPSSVDIALLHTHHFINGRAVEVKRAIPRKPQQEQQMLSPIHSQTAKVVGRKDDDDYGGSNSNQVLKAKKIFVGGLSLNLTEEEFKSYFEKFGTVTDVVVMHDNNTNRPRGFGFITFESEDVVEKIIQTSHHELGGKLVEVKRAVPRGATKNLNNGINSRFKSGIFPHEVSITTRDGNLWPKGSNHGNQAAQLPISPAHSGYYYNNGCLYSSGYPIGGGYGFIGYGMPIASLGSPFSSVGMMPGRTVNYGTGYYPTGVNGGFPMMGMVSPYGSLTEPGINVRANHSFRSNSEVHQRNPTSIMDGPRSNGNESSQKIGKGDYNTKKSSRTPEEQAQPKVGPVSEPS